jgi:hypothetical protein
VRPNHQTNKPVEQNLHLQNVSNKHAVVTQFKILNLNFRYRHNSAPNVKVLAARLGTKENRKYSGGETGSRGWLKGVGHFCLVSRNEHTLRRAIPVSKSCKLNLNNYTTVPSRYFVSRQEFNVFNSPG